jgi:hypothetical protein
MTLPDLLNIITLDLSILTDKFHISQYLFKKLCRPLADSDIKTISSAYIRQDTFMLLIVMGSHMLSNILTISFRYNEKSVGLKIHNCLTPMFDENELASPSVNFIEYLTSSYILQNNPII